MKIVKRRHASPGGKVCDVISCTEQSHKTVNTNLALGTSLNLPKMDGKKIKKVHLCKEHSKVYKKETKEEREMDRLSRT